MDSSNNYAMIEGIAFSFPSHIKEVDVATDATVEMELTR